MSQAGFTPIQLYFSTTAAATPSAGNLANGELAINITDGRLFYKDNGGTVRVLAGTGGSGVVAGSNTQVQFNNNGVFGASANMVFNGTRLTVADLADSGLTAGRVTYASTGGALVDSANLTFDGTTLTANALTVTNATTLSAGTANGVAYLNGSKVLTTGSALTFDGTALRNTSGQFEGIDNMTLSALVSTTNATVLTLNSAGTGGTTRFQINNAEQMRLTSTGLGIGTSSPLTALTFPAGATVSWGSSLGSIDYIQAGSGSVAIGTNGSQKAVINSSGNLGLGVTPSAWNTGSKALDIGTRGALQSGNGVDVGIWGNAAYNTSSQFVYKASAAASYYSQEAGAHRWHTAPSGTAGNVISFTQAMTLDASGNLGVGTTSPGQKLDIRSDTSGTSVRVSTSDNGNIVRMGWKTGVSFLAAEGYNSPVLAFETGGSERARIDSSGNLLVGKTTASPFGAGSYLTPSGSWFCSGAGVNFYHVYDPATANVKFYVTGGGTINAVSTTITAISDQRLKENVQDLDVGLDKIMALKPRKFDWKEGKGKNIKGDCGWIAQEFEQVFPDMVDEWLDPAPEGEEPYKSVRADLIPVLVKAIQEQQALIQTLTARVTALESN